MSTATALSPCPSWPHATPSRAQRSHGRVAMAVARRDGATRLARLHQSGCAKAFLPRIHGGPTEAVIVNTAGGMTGGDRFEIDLELGPKTTLAIATQGAERFYRRVEGVAQVTAAARLSAGARLDWMPQETILFEGSAMARNLTVALPGDAACLIVEALLLGRRAMGETLGQAWIADTRRIIRDGRLVHLDAMRLDGAVAPVLARAAVAAGRVALATVILAAPDAEARLEGLRARLATAGVEAAASAWNGVLVARFAAAEGRALRQAILQALPALRDDPPPRVWMM